MLQKRRVDGIIVIASYLSDRVPQLFERSKVPIIVHHGLMISLVLLW